MYERILAGGQAIGQSRIDTLIEDAINDTVDPLHDRIMQITGDWVLDFQVAEQGEHLVLTIRPEDFYYSDYPRTDQCAQEDIESRLAIARELGFEIIESEI
jgi:hypothetical protein